MTPGRERALAVVLCVVGAAVILFALSQRWIHAVVEEEGLPRVVTNESGRSVVPGAAALALVGLAGAIALLATRRWGRLVVAILVVACGLGVIALSYDLTQDLLGAVSTTITETAGRATPGSVHVEGSPWPWLAILGGVLMMLGGLLAAVRGHRWPGMSRRYETGTATGAAKDEAADQTPDAMWKAIDRGEDPTS